MTTLVFDSMRQFARDWEDLFSSAVLSGIAGDKAHAARGSAHMSIEDCAPGHWSIIRPDDAAPPGSWSRKHAAAVDMSMNARDMVLCTSRVAAVYKDRTDPRRRYVNAINGWRGSGDAERFDFYANTISRATSDHEWHAHLEFRRRYANDPAAHAAVLSILAGQTRQAYVASLQPRTAPAAPAVTAAPTPAAAPRPLIVRYI